MKDLEEALAGRLGDRLTRGDNSVIVADGTTDLFFEAFADSLSEAIDVDLLFELQAPAAPFAELPGRTCRLFGVVPLVDGVEPQFGTASMPKSAFYPNIAQLGKTFGFGKLARERVVAIDVPQGLLRAVHESSQLHLRDSFDLGEPFTSEALATNTSIAGFGNIEASGAHGELVFGRKILTISDQDGSIGSPFQVHIYYYRVIGNPDIGSAHRRLRSAVGASSEGVFDIATVIVPAHPSVKPLVFVHGADRALDLARSEAIRRRSPVFDPSTPRWVEPTRTEPAISNEPTRPIQSNSTLPRNAPPMAGWFMADLYFWLQQNNVDAFCTTWGQRSSAGPEQTPTRRITVAGGDNVQRLRTSARAAGYTVAETRTGTLTISNTPDGSVFVETLDPVAFRRAVSSRPTATTLHPQTHTSPSLRMAATKPGSVEVWGLSAVANARLMATLWAHRVRCVLDADRTVPLRINVPSSQLAKVSGALDSLAVPTSVEDLAADGFGSSRSLGIEGVTAQLRVVPDAEFDSLWTSSSTTALPRASTRSTNRAAALPLNFQPW